MGASSVVQRSKTFSKFLSASKLPAKPSLHLSINPTNGVVAADNEFLVEFLAKPESKSQIEEENKFLAKVERMIESGFKFLFLNQ